MKDGSNTAAELGLPQENVHFESFQANSTGHPFTVELVESQKELEVAADTPSLYWIVFGVQDLTFLLLVKPVIVGPVEWLRSGRVGRVEHRSTGLLENEKDSSMLSCGSRGIG